MIDAKNIKTKFIYQIKLICNSTNIMKDLKKIMFKVGLSFFGSMNCFMHLSFVAQPQSFYSNLA